MTQSKVEETALELITEESTEIAPTKTAAIAEAEIKSAIIVALKFPRNEDACFENLMKSCQRSSFAFDASYEFPRGGRPITGPSVHLAREAARCWGNIRHGVNVIADDSLERTIEAWAWDLQTNTKVTAEDTFQKKIQRKQYENNEYVGTKWVTPNERDLRELSNKRAAILKRNCIFEILPKDFIEDALKLCSVTLKGAAEKDPDGFRKRLIVLFSNMKVSTQMIERALGHPMAESSPDELQMLQNVYTSIKDGNSTWAEYIGTPAAEEKTEGSSQLDTVVASEKNQKLQAEANRKLSEAVEKEQAEAEIEKLKKEGADATAKAVAAVEKKLQEQKEKGVTREELAALKEQAQSESIDEVVNKETGEITRPAPEGLMGTSPRQPQKPLDGADIFDKGKELVKRVDDEAARIKENLKRVAKIKAEGKMKKAPAKKATEKTKKDEEQEDHLEAARKAYRKDKLTDAQMEAIQKVCLENRLSSISLTNVISAYGYEKLEEVEQVEGGVNNYQFIMDDLQAAADKLQSDEF